jgi:ParB family chromosome partitioning protein
LKAFEFSGKTTIPAIVMNVSEEEMLELAVIENIQREDLNPIDEAKAYQMLQEKFNITQEDLSKKMGKDRSTIANTLRLLQLPEDIQEMVADQSLSPGHARAVLSLDSPEAQIDFAREIVTRGYSVRETETKVKKYGKATPIRQKAKEPDPHLSSLEDTLKRTLGTQVKIQQKGSGGRIEISFSSSEEFERLINLFREIERRSMSASSPET